MMLTILDQRDSRRVHEVRLRRLRALSEDQVSVRVGGAVHSALVCRRSQGPPGAIIRYRGYMGVRRLVAAWDETHRLRLVERDGEADA
eukprot:CAMPEP_0170455486 /NCGR_PEP_ID=MMETSP0123-20130129/3437_1 /TAXON_ID=182087 /ORGANISM="Favella ehrenbergii, Strain Fehren 1" /LENGTH=87 /DNA_ID=CAMNT_0010718645 /DNA_START=107 /DNA_END=370 /DNA_ORIENTATION=-